MGHYQNTVKTASTQSFTHI